MTLDSSYLNTLLLPPTPRPPRVQGDRETCQRLAFICLVLIPPSRTGSVVGAYVVGGRAGLPSLQLLCFSYELNNSVLGSLGI